MMASDEGHGDVVQVLLSSGAQVDLQNKVRHNITKVTNNIKIALCSCTHISISGEQ